MCVDNLNGRLFLAGLCKKNAPSCAFDGNAGDFAAWRERAVKKLEELLCFPKLPMDEYNARKLEETTGLKTEKGTEYIRMLWEIDTLQGLKMPVYALVPKKGNNKAALAIHCHGSDGKNGLVGIIKEELEDNTIKFRFRYAFELLEKGYTVFCPDLLGSGTRKPVKPEKTLASECNIINFSLIAIGLNLQGVNIRELQRCIDFIEKSGYNNGDDLVCVGFSSGGINTIWLAALDERVKTAYVSGYFHSFKSTLLQSNLCGCNFVPNLWETVDMDTLAMLAAPRRLFVETGKDDKLNGADGLENVYKLVENTKKVYSGIYNSNNFEFKVCDGAHRWYGAFLDRL